MATIAMTTTTTEARPGRAALVTLFAGLALASSGCDRARALLQRVTADEPEVAADEPADEPADEADAAPSAADPSGPSADPAGTSASAGASTVTRMMATLEAARPNLPVYGVVKDGTRMYTGPNTGSPYVVAGGDDTPIPAHMRSAYGYGYRAAPAEPEIELGRAVRILKLDGDLLEVENITAEDDVLTCAPLQPELAHVRVRLWVPRDALVPVLDHPITVQLDEHAEITLSPGVPAFATAVEDEFHVRASGITLKVKLPAVPTARWHAPGRQTDATGAVGTLGAWYGMTLAGKTFPPMGPAGRQLGQLYGDAAGTTWIFADEIEDGEARVRVKNRCLEVGGVVVTDSRSPAPSAGATPAASRRRLLDRPPAILAGTTLRWEDGTAAGVTVAPVTFGGTPRKQGEDVCFGVTAEAGAPELCASATDVAAAPAGQSESDGLVVTANPGWGMQSEVQHALGDELWENYGDVRECFRKHVKTKGGYNTASANVSLQVKSDGKVHAYWASAWTARGESRSLQRCIEGELAEWTVERPPAEDTSLSLYLVATRT